MNKLFFAASFLLSATCAYGFGGVLPETIQKAREKGRRVGLGEKFTAIPTALPVSLAHPTKDEVTLSHDDISPTTEQPLPASTAEQATVTLQADRADTTETTATKITTVTLAITATTEATTVSMIATGTSISSLVPTSGMRKLPKAFAATTSPVTTTSAGWRPRSQLATQTLLLVIVTLALLR